MHLMTDCFPDLINLLIPPISHRKHHDDPKTQCNNTQLCNIHHVEQFAIKKKYIYIICSRDANVCGWPQMEQMEQITSPSSKQHRCWSYLASNTDFHGSGQISRTWQHIEAEIWLDKIIYWKQRSQEKCNKMRRLDSWEWMNTVACWPWPLLSTQQSRRSECRGSNVTPLPGW